MDRETMNKIKRYFQSVPVERAWLFGSFSRGEETKNSDVDLMVEFIQGVRIGFLYFRMIDDLEQICQRKVDLAEEKMIDHRIIEDVSRDKVLIYERAC